MIPAEWLREAQHRIRAHIRTTPLTYDPELDIYLKWENQQITGSFKLRGALNKILTLQPWERERGLVAASAGNHGKGVALGAQQVGCHAIVFASEHAVASKLGAMRQLGAEVRLVPGGYSEAERAGIAYAQNTSSTWISPYNDAQVIAGQGTLALEILDQSPALNRATWLVPVGGGGLAAGIAAAAQLKLVGVQSTASPFFHAIFHHGSQQGIVELPSLADGLSGAVEEGSVTIPLLRSRLDDLILVTEDEIAQAIARVWQRYGERIEGSAATSFAAVLSGKIIHRPVVLIFSGGNIQPELFEQLINQYGRNDYSR